MKACSTSLSVVPMTAADRPFRSRIVLGLDGTQPGDDILWRAKSGFCELLVAKAALDDSGQALIVGYRTTDYFAGAYFAGNFGSALISRICRMCRCSCVEINSAH